MLTLKNKQEARRDQITEEIVTTWMTKEAFGYIAECDSRQEAYLYMIGDFFGDHGIYDEEIRDELDDMVRAAAKKAVGL